MSKKRTLEDILVEARNTIPELKEGQVFETMTSIYPNDTISPDLKNITVDGSRLTLPKASSSKAKKQFRKKDSYLKELFKDGIKGDYLMVEKVIDKNTFFCKNISIKEEMLDKYFSDKQMKYIRLSKDDILQGNIKRVYRGYKPHINK